VTVPLWAWQGGLLLLEAALEEAPIGMGVVDAQGKYLRVNRALCGILGRAREELLGRPYREAVHPEDLAAETAQLDRLVQGNILSYESESRCVRPDGSVIWVQERVSAACDNAGV